MSLILAGVVLFAHAGHLDDVGLTWDEPAYLESVRRIQAWTDVMVTGPDRRSHLEEDGIREAWNWNPYHNPHPPFYKEVMAATQTAVGGWLGRIPGARLASLLWFALLVGAVSWLASRAWGVAAGLVAGLAAAFMPRLAGHGHIAATDMPLACLFFLATAGFARFLHSGRRRWALVGVVGLGLAMATKFTGYLIPVPLAAWAVSQRFSRRRAMGAAIMGLGALALAVGVNPLAWHDPVGYTLELFRQSLSRERTIPISTMYWGTAYGFALPWHHAIAMTAVTVPLGSLLLALWGGVRGMARWRREPLATLSVTVVVFFWLLLALPASPNHDGVRLFLPSFPFLALLAGRGFADIVPRVRVAMPDSAAGGGGAGRGWSHRLVATALAILLLAPAGVQTLRSRPYYLSYYNGVIGGLRGAARRGMELTYWYDALTPRFLASVNRTLSPGSRLATFPKKDHFLWLQEYGLLRDDVEITGELPSPYFLQYARTAVFDSLQWGLYREVTPVLSVRVDGVTLAALYRWSSHEDVRDQPDPPTSVDRQRP